MVNLSVAPLGSSFCTFNRLDRETLRTIHRVGIDVVELSPTEAVFLSALHDSQRAAEVKRLAAEEGVGLWSVHLPFSEKWDVSSENEQDREEIMEINRKMIRAGAEAGVRVIVLHPSSEPIADADRPRRLELSRKAIVSLNTLCRELGLTLAVENLPRTCLCNRSAEMIALLQGTGAQVCFDFNHSLQEDNADFLTALIDSGLSIATVHISDYDNVDERHRLPGDGVNNWKQLLHILSAADYHGPLLYEIAQKPYQRDPVTPEQLADNLHRLRAGEI